MFILHSIKTNNLFIKLLLIYTLVHFSNVAGAQADTSKQSMIELLSADYSEYNTDIVDAQRIIGSVQFKHNELYMDCDSAYFYTKENKIEAFGHIYIRQKDTLNLWGDYLEYDGDKKLAIVKENVRLKDDEMELTTDLLHYDLNNKIAYYTTGGNIVNGQDKLTSRIGRYSSRSKTFFFKDSVKLDNPEYRMVSDTLEYNTVAKIAYFYGPTHIYSEENTIFCKNGWYNTKENTSQFSKGASITGAENKIMADSMHYNRNTGIGEAFNNIILIDTIDNFEIRGGYGIYYRFTKQTWISDHPMAIKHSEDDTLYLVADTLMDETDSNQSRVLHAFNNAKIYKNDVQGIADSLVYSFTDSTITLYRDPILWSDSNQITGDTIVVLQKNSGLHRVLVLKNAMTIERESSMYYNQISGRQIESKFSNNKLYQVVVTGNGESLYYAKEENGSYSGVSSNICSNMLIAIDSNKVREITFYKKPIGVFYPIEELPEEKEKLNGFKWVASKKPKKSDFIGNQQKERLVKKSIDLNETIKQKE